jgi:TatA/E family protein of Tat protein translocase
MFNIGPLELIVILVVALLVVGPAKLPELGRSIGRGLREFRKAQDEVQRTLRLSLDGDDEPPSRPMRGVESSTATATATATDGDDEQTHISTAEGEPAAEASADSDAGSGTDDVARALGRGLAELRRAKEELQNSFRVDLNDDGGGNGSHAG